MSFHCVLGTSKQVLYSEVLFYEFEKLCKTSHNVFKWVKQHLKIKKFWGDSENAVRIQIYTAIISYCLVAIVHHKMKLKISVYNTLQVLGISLTDTTPLEDLFNKSNLNIDKELDGFYEPTLFDD